MEKVDIDADLKGFGFKRRVKYLYYSNCTAMTFGTTFRFFSVAFQTCHSNHPNNVPI